MKKLALLLILFSTPAWGQIYDDYGNMTPSQLEELRAAAKERDDLRKQVQEQQQEIVALQIEIRSVKEDFVDLIKTEHAYMAATK